MVIDSIGEADASLIGRLGGALELAPQRIAAAVYRAPAILARGLVETEAGSLRAVAAALGLAASVCRDEACPDAGDEEHELAVHVPDVAKIPALAALVERVVGCDAATAARLLWATPAVILGRISAATSAALARRFEAAGAQVDVGRPRASRFELHLTEPGRRAEVEPVLRDILTPARGRDASLLAGDLDFAAAQRAWERASRRRLPVELVDRGLARADVVLRATDDAGATAGALSAALEIPADVVPRLLAHLPLVVGRGLRLGDAERVRGALEAARADVGLRLHALQRFVLRVDAVERPEPASADLAALFGDRPEVMRERLRRLPAVFGGPWGPLHARWLAHAARAVGVAVTLLEYTDGS